MRGGREWGGEGVGIGNVEGGGGAMVGDDRG